MNSCILALLIFGISGNSIAARQEKAPSEFDALLEQVKKGDPKCDFLKLRVAFTQTPLYKPYDKSADKVGKDMEAALERKDYQTALKLAEQLLKSTYVDVKAHIVAARACAELKNPDQAKFHRQVAEGLLRSILKSGNGRSPTTAYVVISVDEEVSVLGALGIEKTAQDLISEKDQKIDRIEGIDLKTRQQTTVYFNVTTPFNWLLRREKGK